MKNRSRKHRVGPGFFHGQSQVFGFADNRSLILPSNLRKVY